jgi:MoxR-like ATPase
VQTVCTETEVEVLRDAPERVHVEDDVRRYIATLTRATRDDERVEGGVSPRGTQRLFEAARAVAVGNGREYVTPADVKAIAQSTLAHRLVLTADARVDNVEKTDVIADITAETQVPTVNYTARASA